MYCWFNSYFTFNTNEKLCFPLICSFYCSSWKSVEPWKLVRNLPSDGWLLTNRLHVKKGIINIFLSFSDNAQKQPSEVFCKNGVLKIFADSTGKQLCWSLFSIKLLAFRPEKDSSKCAFLWNHNCEICEIFKNTYCEKHLWTIAFKCFFLIVWFLHNTVNSWYT